MMSAKKDLDEGALLRLASVALLEDTDFLAKFRTRLKEE